jgi:hypothetical protein
MNIDHEVTLLPNLAPFGTIGCPIGGPGRPGATAPVGPSSAIGRLHWPLKEKPRRVDGALGE